MAKINQIPKFFEPSRRETEIYRREQESGAFHAEINSEKEAFTIVMPPPNITAQLHIGHGLDLSLQDCLIRQKRMLGYEALYLPGADHAAIATEVKIVESLRKEGLSKEKLGRDGFLERAWEWKEEYGNRITEQSKRLGLSADWERYRFTMDEGLSKAVLKAFKQLYDLGLIYRGERLVNWCPTCKTSISDAEVEHEDTEGAFWFIRYPLKDSDDFLTIATTRPETMLGDTALAVNPKDERFSAYIGRRALLPLVGRELEIIADPYVKMDFGTGVVKITPAHDPNDFEMGQRHHLDIINIMNDDGSLNENAGVYAGLSREEARSKIVEDLKAQGYLVKTEAMLHPVGHCYRCHHIVEPRLSLQWFVSMQKLAEPALEAVRSGEVTFVPERFQKLYFNWMENIRDWCISRQLWWGHRIPAWYCDDCGGITVEESEPRHCSHCGSSHIHQDEDTLDTWFSSALWPFSTLGWPDKTPELDYFYPTDVLVTGYDIITFWVSRMIFSALQYTGQAPFRDVFIHGLVRDSQGRKMSKSLGNGIDPLKVIDESGCDALRYALINGVSPGNDTRYSEQKVEAGRNFINKLWNAFRFVMMNLEDDFQPAPWSDDDLELSDRWILSELHDLVEQVDRHFRQYELGLALSKIYSFLWDSYCDWYIEMSKERLREEGKRRVTAQNVLRFVLIQAVKMLHPFMPFVTEDIYSYLEPGQLLVQASWPLADEIPEFPKDRETAATLMEALRAIRNIRSEMNVAPKKTLHLILVSDDPLLKNAFSEGQGLLRDLVQIESLELRENSEGIPLTSVSSVISGAQLFIPLEDLVDIAKERVRLKDELGHLEQEVARTRQKLENQNFVSKAPEAVVQKERDKLNEQLAMLEAAKTRLEQLG